MSKTSNQIILIWKDAEDLLRRNYKSVLNNGQELSVLQVEILQDAISLTVLAWLDILSDFDGYSTRWVRPWLMKVMELDLHDLVEFLKASDSLLLRTTLDEYDNIRTYDDFKRHLKDSFPFSGDLLGPLSKKLDRWLRYSDVTSFACVHTAFVFLTRLNLPGLKSLQEKACEDYLIGEEKLKTSDFTSLEQAIITDWFPASSASFLYENWRPKHGPGITADISGEVSLCRKYKNLRKDAMLNYLDKRLGNISIYPRLSKKNLDRTAKVVFVPKSIDKLRTICAEPTTLQWYQQGFLQSIMAYIDEPRMLPNTGGKLVNHPLRRRVDLKDQKLSRRDACNGSKDGSFATLDLSAASDSVSWPMIQQWTRKSALLAVCWATRSRFCRLPKASLPLGAPALLKTDKFAPMGSALCFPIEIIVFCAIIEAAIKEDCGKSPHKSRYRVYGDDIIVELEYAEAVIARLERNGFKVNTSKSFYKKGTHNYRESCGGEYLDGVNVTPSRLSRRFAGYRDLKGSDASRIEALIEHCNEFYTSLPSVRRRLIASLMEMPIEFRPLFSDASKAQYPRHSTASEWILHPLGKHVKNWNEFPGGSVASFTATNFHLLTSYRDPDWAQTCFVHGKTELTNSSRSWKADEDIRFFEWLRLSDRRGKDEFVDPLEALIHFPGEPTWMRTCVRTKSRVKNK